MDMSMFPMNGQYCASVYVCVCVCYTADRLINIDNSLCILSLQVP